MDNVAISQILILFTQCLIVGSLLLFLFRLRTIFGLGMLFTALGVFQYMQVFLVASLYIEVFPGILISPGSMVMFTGSLFAILLIYIREDALEARKVIYALLAANLVLAGLQGIFSWAIEGEYVNNIYNLPKEFFTINSRVLLVGTIVLFIDAFIIIYLYEKISQFISSILLRILISMVLVVSIDSFLFSLGAFAGTGEFWDILSSGLVAKLLSSLIYTLLFTIYLNYIDRDISIAEDASKPFKDIFYTLTYRQKYETVYEEKESSKKELIISEYKFRALFQTMAQGVTYQNANGEITDANPAALEILGLTLDQLQGKTSFDPDWKSIHEDGTDFPGNEHPSMVAIQTGKEINNVVMGVFNPKVNDYRWIKIDAIPQFRNGESVPYQVFTTFDDITEAKRMEVQLRENEKRYVKAQQLGKVGNWEYDLETEHFWGSQEARRIFGFHPQANDFTTELVESCIPERERVHQALVDLIENGAEYNLEYEVLPKGGSSARIVHSIAELETNSDGKPLRVMGVIQDISSQKSAQEKIHLNAAILSASQKIAKVGGWQWDVIDKKMFWTDETYHIHDFEKEDFEMGSDAHINESLKCYTLEDREKIALAFNKCIKTGEGYEFTVPFTTAKGNKRWIQTSAEAIGESGKVKKVTGVIQDITESKIAQEGLRLSEAHFRSLMENVQGFVLYRLHKNENQNLVRVQLVSPSIKKLLGVKNPYNIDEWFSNIHPDDLERVKKANSISIHKGQPFDEVMQILHPDHKARLWIHAISYPVYSENDHSIYFNGIIIEITSRKQAEEKLIRNEKELRKALAEIERSEFLLNETGRLAQVGGWDLDLKTMTPYFSDETYRIYEIPPGKPPKVEDGINFYAPNARPIVQKAVADAIEEQKPYDITVPFISAKGTKKWVRTQGWVQLKNNKPVRLYGAIQDITQQKEAEIELRESEEKFRLIAENTHDVISLHDTEGKYLFISPSIKTIRGYEPDELIGRNPYDYIHPQDIPLITHKDHVEKLQQGNSILVVYRFKSKSGKYEWFESYRQAIFNENKEIVRIVSVSRDITERKEKESEIENYQKSLQSLTTEISLVEEKQRKEIAENIHDHLSQSLVISKMKLNDLQKELKNPASKGELKLIIEHISNALENSRKITYDLSPPVLYELGLIETMYWLVEKIEAEYKLKATFVTELDELNLPEQKLILIYRIIQELINNIVKHAKAGKIDISFRSKSEGMEIAVIDDGEGFDVNKLTKFSTDQGGFGLFAVKERVQNLGGTFAIDTEKRKGTNVKIYIPLKTI